MTFPEMLLSMLGVSAALGVVLMVCVSLRADTAQAQTVQTLAALRTAYEQWHADPSPAAPAAAAAAAPPLTTSDVLRALLDHPRARQTLTAAGVRVDTLVDGSLRVRDGYGWPIRFLPPTPAAAKPTVAHPGPTPTSTAPAATADFASAGPDGRFGDHHATSPAPAPAPAHGTAADSDAGADDLLASDRENTP